MSAREGKKVVCQSARRDEGSICCKPERRVKAKSSSRGHTPRQAMEFPHARWCMYILKDAVTIAAWILEKGDPAASRAYICMLYEIAFRCLINGGKNRSCSICICKIEWERRTR